MNGTLAPEADRTAHPREPAPARTLRTGLLALAAIGVLGTVVELITIQHWESADQLIPWVVLAVLAVTIAVVAVRPTRATVWGARLVGAATCLGGLYGVIEHVESNLHSGPLDATYGPRWDGMSQLSRLWAAATGGVGPSPTLAPAILTQIGLMLLLATVAHPAVARATDGG